MNQERLPGSPLPVVTIDSEQFKEGLLVEVLPQLNTELHEIVRRGFNIDTVGLREDVVEFIVAANLLDKAVLVLYNTDSVTFELIMKGLMPKWNIRIMKLQSGKDIVPLFTTFDKNNEAIVY